MSDHGELEHAASEVASTRRSPCSVIGCAVIALLLIVLALVVFPVWARHREKARATSCLSNVKQLGLALMQYAHDHDDTMPDATRWCDLTLPYTRNSYLHICPDADAPWRKGVGTYAMNGALSGHGPSGIGSPEEMVALFDSPIGWNLHGGPSLVVNRHKKRTEGIVDRMINGRRIGANVTFADGHSKWIDERRVADLVWTLPPPASDTGP